MHANYYRHRKQPLEDRSNDRFKREVKDNATLTRVQRIAYEMTQTCNCNDPSCKLAGGYLFYDSGVSVCSAGCVYDMVGDSGAPTFETHTSFKGVAANLSVTPTTNLAGSDRPLSLRGRTSADTRAILQMCRVMNLPEGVLSNSISVLESANELPGKDLRRRGTRRQALLVAIVCMACDMANVEHHGERLRNMCEIMIGKAKCAENKAYVCFARTVRAMGIVLNRALNEHTGAVCEADFTQRIMGNAWTRLARCGLNEADIARITDLVDKIATKWSDAPTKLGDALVPCAVQIMRGPTDACTIASCNEYKYRRMTIAQHCKKISLYFHDHNKSAVACLR